MTRAPKLLCLGILIFWLTLACGVDDKGGSRLAVNIGVVQSISGPGGVYGKSGVEGIELAIEELKSLHPNIVIDYSVSDDQSDVNVGVMAYEGFVRKKVTAILGPSLSNVGFPALRVAQEARIPAISPMTTAEGIGEIGDYVFRVALAEDVAMPALVKQVSILVPISRGVMFFDGADAYSRSSAEGMRKGMSAIGATVTLEVDLSQTSSLDHVLADPRLSVADVFLVPTFTETAAPVLRALRQTQLTQPVIGGEALASIDLVRLAGAASNGAYVASTWHPAVSNDLSRHFVEAYSEAYGHPPDNYAAVSYAATYLLIDSIQRAASTEPSRVRDALAATQNLDTVLGKFSISDSGDAIFMPVFQQFRNGELQVIE